MDPNVFTLGEFYTKNWQLIAIKDIKKGDELTQNYNQSCGYELRTNEVIMRDFLKICGEYNVEKRPSKLTLSAVKVRVRSSKL